MLRIIRQLPPGGGLFKYEKAFEFYEKAMKIHLKELDEEHPDVAQMYSEIRNLAFFSS